MDIAEHKPAEAGERSRLEAAASMNSHKFAVVNLVQAELRKSGVASGKHSTHQLGHPKHSRFVDLARYLNHLEEWQHWHPAKPSSPSF